MDLREVQQAYGLGVEPLTIREARRREPLLSPGISCALDIPADHQVDPRRLVARACCGAGRPRRGNRRQRTDMRSASTLPACSGTAGGSAGSGWPAAGPSGRLKRWWPTGWLPRQLQDLPEGLQLPLRPVYGDILRLRVPAHLQPLLTATVRGMVRGVPVYIVPRQDGTVVIGATQREDGVPGHQRRRRLPAAPRRPGAGARGGRARAPGSHRAGTAGHPGQRARCWAGFRPERQGAGRDVAGLIIATGFFRHGVLLTPAAAAICRELMDGVTDPRWAAFRPDRFSASSRTAGTALHSAHPG